MSFDLLAPHYRWIEFVLAGEKLQRCRTAHLDSVAAAKDVLIIGEGNGRFLKTFSAKFPNTNITVVDASKQMLELAKMKLQRSGFRSNHIEFIHADILTWQSDSQRFDLVVTNFLLDCFNADQLKRVIATLAHSAQAQASWLIADFQIPTNGWRRWRAQSIHALMYAFFRVFTKLSARCVTAPDSLLREHGFDLTVRQTREWDLLHSDLWQRPPQPSS